MQKTILLLIFYISSFAVLAQTSSFKVSGKVIDAQTKLPLEAASVFAQNTTYGTTTDKDGNFTILFQDGGYDLVVTYTGYKTEIRSIGKGLAVNINFVIQLQKNEKELANIIIQSGKQEINGWETYGAFFLDNFIGNTPNSKMCSISNKDALQFYLLKKRNCLKILANEPLEIVNKALGYTIIYSLDSFVYDFNRDMTVYNGHPFFKENQPADSAQEKTWAKNRVTAYSGSTLHFMRSIFNQQLKEEGFELKAVRKIDDNKKPIPISDFYDALRYFKIDSIQTVEILPKFRLVKVIYHNAKPDYEYMNNYPQGFSKFQSSVIEFLPNEKITIESNGYYYKQNGIIKNDYLSWKRMADTLPFDYYIN